MITVRPSQQRGHANHGWLDSRFSFSFADYYDPKHMGFRTLRVINDDLVAAGAGFPMHPHRDMEIVTYMVDGALEHRDSMGNGSTILEGEVQRMTAGTGILHSEFNPLTEGTTRLLQIWIVPRERGLKPGYDQKHFPAEAKLGKLLTIASPDGRDGSMKIEQDITVYASRLTAGCRVEHAVAPDRHAWVQVVRGSVTLNGTSLAEGDGAAISGETSLELRAEGDGEFLLFDLS